MSGTNISFQKIPSALRAPGFFVEIGTARANTATSPLRAVLVGQMAATGTAISGVPFLVQSVAQVQASCGAGSAIARMAYRYRLTDSFGELWALPIADASGSVAATGSFPFVGTALAAGAISAYVGGRLVSTGVSAGDTAAVIAGNMVVAANALPALAATATASTGTVTMTAVNKGLVGNDIDLRLNYLGVPSGQVLPSGITCVPVAMTGGATPPVLTAALANLADSAFEFFALGLNDPASLTAMAAFLNDTVGRWSWSQMLYGHSFTAYRSTLGGLQTFGTSRNDPPVTIMGIFDVPHVCDEWAADVCAAAAGSVRADPALPFDTLALSVSGPPVQSRFPLSARNTLLYSGISTFKTDQGGNVTIDRLITTSQFNASGVADDSYLSTETRFQLPYVIRDLRTYIASLYARKILVSDTTKVATNPNVATPAMIKASVISRYRVLEAMGEVQNGDAFAAAVQVQIKSKGTVAIYWPGDLADQLHDIDTLVEFAQP